MVLLDEEIDKVAEAWGLYDTQDNGKISRHDLRCAVDECIEKFKKKLAEELLQIIN